ncbi:terpene synthase family protein [Streptomyces mirabilis]|uniref:terpene synthase family protein n=1 Tax=Streptomyces mirabilis TaxID=68239 RepID=UPI003253B8E3
MKTAGKAAGGVAATVLPLSPAERAAGLSLPAAVFNGPQPRSMREIAVDITLMCDDLYSLEEVAHGGVPLLDAFGRPSAHEGGGCRMPGAAPSEHAHGLFHLPFCMGVVFRSSWASARRR